MQNEKNQIEGMNPIARHNARRYALQAMYQWHIANTDMIDIEKDFIENRIDKPTDMSYFKELIHGIAKECEHIDQTFVPYLGRAQSEIDPVELMVLRIATYELLYRLDVPYRVVINEALVLTKKFGSIEGFKFVNGVLDKVAKRQRTIESQGK